jgi:hypothetical protein
MKAKYVVIFVLLILINISLIYGQGVETKGRFTNSIYAFEPTLYRGTEDSKAHVLLYQYLRLQASMKEANNLTLYLDTRLLTDLEEDLDNDYRYRLNRLSLSAENLFSGWFDFQIGRFFYHPGITFGSLDGAEFTVKPTKAFHIQLYGGVETHHWRTYKVYDFDDATVYGGALKYFGFLNSNWQLSYLEKLHQKETQWQIVGFNFSNFSLKTWKFLLQTHYDIANSRLHRLYFSTRFAPSKTWHFNLNLKQQHPQIYADSYFNDPDKFGEWKQYRQGALGGTYYFSEKYALTATYQILMLEEGEGHRIIASVNNFNGSLGLIYEMGDLGDQLGFLINYGYEFLPGLIGSLSIDYSRYRFSEIYDYENQIGNALRLTYKFAGHWRIDAEYQLLTNKFKNTDHRFLNHINYIW